MYHRNYLLSKCSALVAWAFICSAVVHAQAPAAPAKPAAGKASSEEEALQAAKWLQGAFASEPTTEAAEMLIAIAKGSQLGPGEGWFHPGVSRYGWKWLAAKHGIPATGSIAREQFHGPTALFDRLDRNKDGALQASDFDWSDRSAFAQQSWTINRFFRRINKAGDGRLTREEWLRFFDEAAAGKDHFTTDNLRDTLFTTPSTSTQSAAPDGPSPQTLVRGLFRGEIGSLHEGPKLEDRAPDFSLRLRDGKETVRLSDHFGKKPIVLVFGNFTCGPFRSMYARVDELSQRYKKDAEFYAVYVREAHPTDGWRMSSNDDAGVTLAQPRSYTERVTVANRCSAKLKMNIPLLVDEIDDRVGNAYSGMPARLYVIDRDGKIAYKSGRGPFGFKPDEMEQALSLLLLDQASPSSVTESNRVPAKP